MSRVETSFVTGESPLTDPRSLAGSVLFHSLLLLIFWLIILNAARPSSEAAAQPLAPRSVPSISRRFQGRRR